MLLRPRLVKDQCPSDILLHQGPLSTSEGVASWSRCFPFRAVYLQEDGDFYRYTVVPDLSLGSIPPFGGASPFGTNPVRPFLAPGPVPTLGKPPKWGFLRLGILSVCDLLTGGATLLAATIFLTSSL